MIIKRVASYIRVSTEEQALKGTSLDEQIDQIRQFCAQQKWEIVIEYSDPGVSGKSESRPGLDHLLIDAGSHLFDGVVIANLSRFARNLRLLLNLEAKLRDCNVTLNSVKENIDTSTAFGRTIFQILGIVGEWERESIIERTRGGRRRRYLEGRWGPGKPSYGYYYGKDSGKLVISENEAKVVKRIFSLYIAGKSIASICDILNEEHIPTRTERAKGWHSGAIRDIIVNPAYKGELIVNRNAPISRLRHGIPNDAIKIMIPPIVEAYQWELAQQHLMNNKHIQPARVNPWLLQGLISCGECGHTFRGDITHQRRYYSCTGRLKRTHVDSSPRCAVPRIDSNWLEAQVWSRVNEILDDPERLEQLISETIAQLQDKEADLISRISPIERRLNQIAAKKKKLAEDWLDEALGKEEVTQRRQRLLGEEARLKSLHANMDPAEIEKLQRTKAMLRFWQRQENALTWNLADENGKIERMVEEPHQIVQTLVSLENNKISDIMSFPASKREWLDRLQVRIVIYNDKADINAIFPLESIDSSLYSSNCR